MGKTATKNSKSMSNGRLESEYQATIREIKVSKKILLQIASGIYEGKMLKTGLIDITKRQAGYALKLKKEMARRNDWNVKNGRKPKFKI